MMQFKNLLLLFVFISIILTGVISSLYAVGSWDEIAIEDVQEGELEELYRRFKEGDQINIYYHKETIIQEPTREEYLEHLVRELKTALKKGKKYGILRRVEGNLAEIDKGAIHKVRERDVFNVYDNAGKYKGRVEIGAIADAVSIGRNYKVKNIFTAGDKVKFLGQRRIFKIGFEYARNIDLTDDTDELEGLGLLFEYTIRGGWGFELLASSTYRIDTIRKDNNKCEKRYTINLPFGINKYFNSPHWFSPHVGIGGAFEIIHVWSFENYKRAGSDFYVQEKLEEKAQFIPVFKAVKRSC